MLLGALAEGVGWAGLMLRVSFAVYLQRPRFVRGMMTAAQFKELLENEEKENVVKICGASTCKAGKGCKKGSK